MMRGSGGTEGGLVKFAVGLALAGLGTYFFFDSIRVSTAGHGLVSGLLGYGRGGVWDTTSTGVLFVPFFLGILALFYDARPRWPWALMFFGLGVLAVEILSRIQFYFNVKLNHLLLMVGLFAAGLGLMLRSFRDESADRKPRE